MNGADRGDPGSINQSRQLTGDQTRQNTETICHNYQAICSSPMAALKPRSSFTMVSSCPNLLLSFY
jgi:hypothetical protein